MANVLNTDKQIAVIGALAEGSSIRSIERMTGVHRDTIMRLGVKVGQGCTALMDEKMRNLSCNRLEMDEIWGFVGKKERNVRKDDDAQVGSVWTFCAIDADTKLVPAFRVGERERATANAFVQDVADRMSNRVQISTDGLGAYVDAIEMAFGEDADYGQIIKTYGQMRSSTIAGTASRVRFFRKEGHRRQPELRPDFYQLRRAAERYHPASHAPSDSPDAGIQQEAGELRGGGRTSLRLLQLREASQHAALHPSDGRWSHAQFWSVGDLVEAAA